MRLVVRGRRVVRPGGVQPATVHVSDGVIARVGDYDDVPRGASTIDAGDLVVLPGLVDTHVHINDPGRSDWEGFEHATRAAAAGGVTTLVDMPLNSVPPTTSVAGFEAKLLAADGRCHVDVGFWGGVVPGNADVLEPLAARGALGFKCFLSPSGVDEFPHVNEADLRAALPVVARLGLPLLAHAELPARLREPGSPRDPRDYRTWLESRPAESETAAIDLLIQLAAEFGAHVHIVHLASADALSRLSAAREKGVRVTVETCPHYLSFAAEEIAKGATPFKCAPPIRERAHRERLWDGLASGRIDLIATDHSPAPAVLKHVGDGDFLRAWGGIASLQLGLSAVWTGASARLLPFDRIAAWMAAAPARLAGLARSKGAIETGLDADLVLWDPEAETAVDPSSLQHRHPITPYAGMRLRGRVRTTLVRGDVVFDDGRFADTPRGRVLPSRSERELV
ncbi:MAG TPA: allantoinase AllB [Vicinamibacterales bacterium]|nr:allantoinase AllB [Vicinamibacterales bacterium]